MKSAMILCAVAIISCIGTGNAANNAGTAALTRLKTTTKSTSSDLDRYGRNLIYNTKMKLGNLKITELTNINSITNPAAASIQSEIDSAKANGKNVDHCFEPSRQRIRLASLNAFKILDQCATDNLAPVNGVKTNIDAHVLLGGRIVNDLDAIAINCISSNAMATQNCIIAKIPDASATVNIYGNTATQLKNTGDSASLNAQNSARTCYQSAVQTVRQETSGAQSDARQCIANA